MIYDENDVDKWRKVYLQQAMDFDSMRKENTTLKNELEFLKKESDRVLFIKETKENDIIETKINKKEAYTLVVDKYNELRNLYIELQKSNDINVQQIEFLMKKISELENENVIVLNKYNDMSLLDRLKKKSLN